MDTGKIAARIREMLKRRARFSLVLKSYDGKFQHWKIEENGKVEDGELEGMLDVVFGKVENKETATQK